MRHCANLRRQVWIVNKPTQLYDFVDDPAIDETGTKTLRIRGEDHPVLDRSPGQHDLGSYDVGRLGVGEHRIHFRVDAGSPDSQSVFHLREAQPELDLPLITQTVAGFAVNGLLLIVQIVVTSLTKETVKPLCDQDLILEGDVRKKAR